jgi:hypothetical protein
LIVFEFNASVLLNIFSLLLQLSIATLEAELREVEEKLERSKRYLEVAREEERLVEGLTVACMNNDYVVNSLVSEKRAASSSERKVATLKGLRKWKPSTITASELSFNLIGPCPKACILLSCFISSSGTVACKAHIQPNLFEHKRNPVYKQFKPVASFIETHVSAICASISQKQLDSPRQIGSLLRRVEWALGRLEDTTAELAMLKRRYKANLLTKKSRDSLDFDVEVDFFYPGNSAMLRATFGLSDAYPFSPVSVNLEAFQEQVDVAAIQKILLKNAKPGFGYLSRTCDVVSAFVRKL